MGGHLCSSKKPGGNFFQIYERYHSCSKRNRNNTRKAIDYKLTTKCGKDNKCETNERCWKETKSKYLKNKIYYTIQHKRLLDKKYQIKFEFEKLFKKIKRLLIEELLKIGAFHSNFAVYSKNSE